MNGENKKISSVVLCHVTYALLNKLNEFISYIRDLIIPKKKYTTMCWGFAKLETAACGGVFPILAL